MTDINHSHQAALADLRAVLIKHNIYIGFTCDPCSDTHGLTGDTLVVKQRLGEYAGGADPVLLDDIGWGLYGYEIPDVAPPPRTQTPNTSLAPFKLGDVHAALMVEREDGDYTLLATFNNTEGLMTDEQFAYLVEDAVVQWYDVGVSDVKATNDALTVDILTIEG